MNEYRSTNARHFSWIRLIALWSCVAAAVMVSAPRAFPQDLESETKPSDMIGQAAPAWKTHGWVNSEALDIKQFRGKVVLLRFLNDAVSSAKALNDFDHKYHDKGLAVIGMYAPEPFPVDVSPETVRELAASHGFSFPIGVDSRWETLNRYWLERADAQLTAATFVIDRNGVIRYVQADGVYEMNAKQRGARNEYVKLERVIEALLSGEEPDAKKRASH